jgi:hypothetical protein
VADGRHVEVLESVEDATGSSTSQAHDVPPVTNAETTRHPTGSVLRLTTLVLAQVVNED